VAYGHATEAQREEFERLLAADPDWLGSRLRAAGYDEDRVVVIDTPPGHSVYLQQVLECGDIVLPVVLADAGSSATLPSMEACLSDATARRPSLESTYVINQADPEDPLSRDVIDLLRIRLGKRLAPTQVQLDESVREALAFQQPVLCYDAHGQASHDLDRLSMFVIDRLSR
jgi:cellulose synthase operon protein YhjQ